MEWGIKFGLRDKIRFPAILCWSEGESFLIQFSEDLNLVEKKLLSYDLENHVK